MNTNRCYLLCLVVIAFFYAGCFRAEADDDLRPKMANVVYGQPEPEPIPTPLEAGVEQGESAESICPENINTRKRGFERAAAFRALDRDVQNKCWSNRRNYKWVRRQHARLDVEQGGQKIVREDNGLMRPKFAQAGG